MLTTVHLSFIGFWDGAAAQIQVSQGFQPSSLLIPVSVPVLGKESPFSKPSTQSVKTSTFIMSYVYTFYTGQLAFLNGVIKQG